MPLVLLGASAVFAVLILVKTAGFFAQSAWAEGLVRRAIAQDGSPGAPGQVTEAIAKSTVLADGLKKANLFSPPEARQHPVASVMGILGDEVLIADNWYKAGDMVQDARIVSVEATVVRIKWDGKEKIFSPLDATGQPVSGGDRRTSRISRLTTSSDSPARKAPQTVRTERLSGEFKAGDGEKSRQKAEKQKLAIEKKELRRDSVGDVKKAQPDKKKRDPDEISKATSEQVAEKKAERLKQK